MSEKNPIAFTTDYRDGEPGAAPVTLPIWGDPRPMDTAPRDGTEILVRVVDMHVQTFRVLSWENQRTNPLWTTAEGAAWFEAECLGWWPLPGAKP